MTKRKIQKEVTETKIEKSWHWKRIPFITAGLGVLGMLNLSIMVALSPRYNFGIFEVMGNLLKQLGNYYIDIFGGFYVWEPVIPFLLVVTAPALGVTCLFTRRNSYIPISIFLAFFFPSGLDEFFYTCKCKTHPLGTVIFSILPVERRKASSPVFPLKIFLQFRHLTLLSFPFLRSQ